MMKLYEFPPTRSIRARWALQECGAAFESHMVSLVDGAHLAPEFLAINPAGKLPALVDGDLVMTESAAIVLYLAEKFPAAALLPEDAATRAQMLRWLMFAVTELEQPLWRMARHTDLYPEEDRLPAEVDRASRDFMDMMAVLEAHLEGRDYVAGDTFTAADIVCGYTLDWAEEAGLLAPFNAARRYLEAMYTRPAAPLRIREASALLERGT